MKKFILLSLVLILEAGNSFSQTSIPGGVVSGTWTKANSPYLVQGAIMIANGTTLIIDSGVTVEFQGSYKFLVLGQLVAVGTAADTIIFTAADTTVGWLGIRFDSTSSTNDSSKFSYCKIQYGKVTGTSSIFDGGALYFYKFSKAIISNSLISNCSAKNWGGGIYCNLASPVIYNNTISNNIASDYGGGGIYFNNANPTISNNIISNNTTLSYTRGGGICCYSSNSAIISYNTISNNTTYRGGGVFCGGGTPVISNNIITGNTASGTGSGVNCEAASPTISNNTFSNNNGTVILCESTTPVISKNKISNNNGIGISCISNSTAIISDNNISNNNGSGISCSGSSPTISNDSISNNTAINGGGIYCQSNSTASISNNIISNNTASSNGGGIYCVSSSPAISNNTISNNLATKGGALFCGSSSSSTVRNTIMWGNNATTGSQVYLDDEPSDPNIYYCDVQGGAAAFGLNSNVFYLGTFTNNIDSNPMFFTPSNGSGTGFNGLTANWSLQNSSPCINTGDPTGSYPATDIAGHPRVVGGIIDIGAYEYGCSASSPFVTTTGATTFCQGGSVTLNTNSASAISYLWSNNSTTQSITVSTSGNYSVIIADSNGCFASSNSITVTVNQLPTIPSISANGTILISSSATGNQWYLNGNIISGETSQTFNVTQNGSYTVIVTINSCSSTSATYNFSNIGINDFSKNSSIKIIPNPFKEKFTVNSNSSINSIEIYDVLGKKIYQSTVVGYQIAIDISQTPTGIYFIAINSGNKFYFQKLIKQ